MIPGTSEEAWHGRAGLAEDRGKQQRYQHSSTWPVFSSLLLSPRCLQREWGRRQRALEKGKGKEMELGNTFLLQAPLLAPQPWGAGDSCLQAQDSPLQNRVCRWELFPGSTGRVAHTWNLNLELQVKEPCFGHVPLHLTVLHRIYMAWGCLTQWFRLVCSGN